MTEFDDMQLDEHWILIADVLGGRATDSDRAALDRWIGVDPARRRLVDEARRTWELAAAAPDPMSDVDVGAAWRSVQGAMEHPAVVPSVSAPRVYRTPRMSAGVRGAPVSGRAWLLRAAAAVVLVAGGAVLARHLDRTSSVPVQPPAMREVATQPGQRAQLTLEDGTRVVLGNDSRLRWSTAFGGDSRDVQLEGEAAFTVTHDERRPFRVHAGSAIAEDLGTEFAVRAYPDGERVTVAVREGMVRLGAAYDADASRRVLLERGDAGYLVAGGATIVEHDVDLDRHFAFAEGRLVFVQTPVREVMRALERRHDIEVRLVGPALARGTVTASFRDEGLSVVLAILAASLDAHVEQDGRVVTFRSSP